jgi:succinyl-CoA synthetase beta subunit
MSLLKSYGITVARGSVAKTPQEAKKIAEELGSADVVVKAQVLAGGRGKGYFDSGLKGGVKLASSPTQALEFAEKMLGHQLITKQTGAQGRPCNEVLLPDLGFCSGTGIRSKRILFCYCNGQKDPGTCHHCIIARRNGH